jgi:outer membrane lipoprotein-sorting protein
MCSTLKYFLFIAGAALVGFSFLGQGANNAQLKAHVDALQAAKSLRASFTVTVFPAAPESYSIAYSKPNLFRIDSPEQLVVCDGSKTTTLDKATNTFMEQPASFVPIKSDGVIAWSAFFDPKAFAEAKSVSVGARRKIKGKAVTELIVDLTNQSVTLYVDDAGKFARGASAKSSNGEKQQETLSMAEELTLGAEPLPESEFTFVAPPGAKLQDAPKVEAVPYSKIQAIFDRSCVRCHGGGGALDLTSYGGLMAGAGGRPVILPGDPKGSALVQYIQGNRSPRMPKGGQPLSHQDIKLISDWIAGGANNN